MNVGDQIADAEYFLRILRDKYSREEIRPNLTAFLAISRGIIDYLLEDYNVKFGLNIPLSKKLCIYTFEDAAKSQNNQSAQRFIGLYRAELAALKKTPIGDLMFSKRNISIHRKPASVRGGFSVRVYESVRLEEKLEVSKIHQNGTVEQIYKSPGSQQEKQRDESLAPSEAESKWFFTDYHSKEVPDVCRDFLDLVRNFVNNIHNKFP
jgi:hypothetical protein